MRAIKALGTGAPATIPVRRLGQDQESGRGRARSSSNMAGTPWRAVHFSAERERSTAGAEKVGDGRIMVLP